MQKKKCNFYPKCMSGDTCQFLHEDAAPAPNAKKTTSPTITTPPPVKLCAFFAKGNCNKTPCKFFHPAPTATGEAVKEKKEEPAEVVVVK